MSEALFTGLDLYRIGNAAGPGLDSVRTGIDISVISVDGVDWVEGTPNGGIHAVFDLCSPTTLQPMVASAGWKSVLQPAHRSE